MPDALNFDATTDELIIRKTVETLEDAQLLAQKEASNIIGTTIPVMLFKQGQRLHMSGAVPMGLIAEKILVQGATKGPKASLSDARSALNRPEDPDHTSTIAKYLLDNFEDKYILPPLTLNVRARVSVYVPNYSSEIKPAYLVIPRTAALAVTDGQHRCRAIKQLLEKLEGESGDRFASDAVAIMITTEAELTQIHQDFADCSRTKPLPASQVAVFDQRNPANRLVLQMEDRCRLFKGRIDPVSKNLSKQSPFVFLANQVRQLVKELVAGSFAMPDDDFEVRARQQLRNDQDVEAAVTKFSAFMNHLSGAIPVWKELVEIQPGTTHVSQIPRLRQEGWICLTVTGLNVIGRIAHELFSKPALEAEWTTYADRLAAVDWARCAPIWQGNIVQSGKIRTQNSPVKEAVQAVRVAIGLAPGSSANGTLPLGDAEASSTGTASL